MKVVDSSFIIDLLREDPAAVEAAERLDEGSEAMVTAVSVYELVYGVYSGRGVDRARRRREVDGFLSGVDVAPLDRRAAELAGEMLGGLSREGRPIDVLDGMIGAIGLAAGCDSVVTRNGAHFERMRGLKVVDY